MNTIHYRGHTIEPSHSGHGYDFFPTQEGRDEDYDWTGDGWRNCGNVGHAMSIEGAKDEIIDKIMMATPQHKVVMNNRPYFFDYIEEAIKFAVLWNAEGFYPANQ